MVLGSLRPPSLNLSACVACWPSRLLPLGNWDPLNSKLCQPLPLPRPLCRRRRNGFCIWTSPWARVCPVPPWSWWPFARSSSGGTPTSPGPNLPSRKPHPNCTRWWRKQGCHVANSHSPTPRPRHFRSRQPTSPSRRAHYPRPCRPRLTAASLYRLSRMEAFPAFFEEGWQSAYKHSPPCSEPPATALRRYVRSAASSPLPLP